MKKTARQERHREVLRDLREVDDWIESTERTPEKSILIGVLINASLFVGAIGLCLLFDMLNVFSVLGILLIQAAYFSHSIRVLPLGSVGVPLYFGKPTGGLYKMNPDGSFAYTTDKEGNEKRVYDERSFVFSAGKHWTLSPFYNFEAVNMMAESISFTINVNAAGTRLTKKERGGGAESDAGIVRCVIHGLAEFRIFNPWQYVRYSKDIIEAGRVAERFQEAGRELATEYTEARLRQDKGSVKQALLKAADEETDNWGLRVVNVDITKIETASSKVAEAHETAITEERRLRGKEKVRKFTKETVRDYVRLGIDPNVAVIAADRELGKAPAFHHNSFGGVDSGSDPLGVMRAAALYASSNTPSSAPQSKKRQRDEDGKEDDE